MTNTDTLATAQDERIMAALSHIAVLLPLMGVIAPIIIWVTQKEKSKYVAFQALQAVAFQLIMIVAYFVGMGCYMLSAFGLMFTIPFAESSSTSNPLFSMGFILPLLVFGVILLGGLFFIIYGIVGAVRAFQGKPFRYALIGSRVERYLQPKPEQAQAGGRNSP